MKILSVFTAIAMMLASVSALATDLKIVENKKVCMVTNKVFEKDQIPVAVNGKTYYGCCDMCKDKLANSTENRTAVDPVSKKKVDKATAVTAVDDSGSVYYFENKSNVAKYK